jgi:hypothetical protein
MSDELSRLFDDPDEAAVADVLRAALDDAPSVVGVRRAARALGVAPAVALATAKSAAAGTVATALASSSVAPSATHLALATLAKWLGAGLLAGSITSLAATRLPFARIDERPASRAGAVLRGPAPLPENAATTLTAAPASGPSLPALVDEPGVAAAAAPLVTDLRARPRAVVDEPRVAAPGSPSSRAAEPTRVNPAVATPVPAASSLERELARLDQARRAVVAHDPDAALSALSAYDRELEAPALRAEATLLRVQALVAKGRVVDAQHEVRRVLAVRPLDGYTCRLTRLAALGDSGCVAVAPRR